MAPPAMRACRRSGPRPSRAGASTGQLVLLLLGAALGAGVEAVEIEVGPSSNFVVHRHDAASSAERGSAASGHREATMAQRTASVEVDAHGGVALAAAPRLVPTSLIRRDREQQQSQAAVESSHKGGEVVAEDSALGGLAEVASALTASWQIFPSGEKPKGEKAIKAYQRVRFGALFPVVVGFAAVLIIIMVMSIALMHREKPETEDETEKPIHYEPESLDSDLHGLAITSIVRDLHRMVAGTEALYIRVSRMGVTLVVLLFSMILQVYLLQQMKTLVTSEAVSSVRVLYDKFEMVMYGSNVTRMETTPNGFHRGQAQFYDPANFAKLSDDEKDNVCRVPLSQPTFFMTILLIWSFIVIADIRKVSGLAHCLLIRTPTAATMDQAIKPIGEEANQEVLIAGLTRTVKFVLSFLLFIPRLIVDVVLLWLGCRLLAATLSFTELLLNAVGLEFVLNINGILFSAMVPKRNSMETSRTHVLPSEDDEPVSAWSFLSTFLWGLAGIAWVLAYMYVLQSVLPDYRWDVQDACVDYLFALSQPHNQAKAPANLLSHKAIDDLVVR